MNPWLFSWRADLLLFLAPAVVALALVPFGPSDGETPFGMWLVAVLLVDVAHVWTTIYRTYLDRDELRRRPVLYTAVPIASYAIAVGFLAISFAAFWTALAYVAVFHFVRQQYGWVALYNRRDPTLTKADRWIDTAAIYASTVFPILWWHANLPRKFVWFLPGDFIPVVPDVVVTVLWPVYVGALVVFALRQVQRWRRERTVRTGKLIVVATTAACWGVGIIATNTDWAFTVTNVLIHGVPYFGLVWLQTRAEGKRFASPASVLPFYALVAGLAYVEELGWDRLIWHTDGPIFFGPAVELGPVALLLVMPLLALPQLVHYVLDGFIWRRAH